MQHTKQGYVFIVVLIILSTITFLLTYLTAQSDAFVSYARVAVDQQKARELALAGVHLGMSQLADGMRSTDEKKEKKIDSDDQLFLRLLRTLLPVYGKMQTYDLKRDPDGITGKIQFCITSEEGKIDLNAVYDFKTHKFVGEGQQTGDYKKIMEQWCGLLESRLKTQDLFQQCNAYMRKQTTVLNDSSQLLALKALNPLQDSLFYIPSTTTKDRHEDTHSLYLEDMFTVWTGKRTLDPWLLTDSLCAVLGLKRRDTIEKDEVKMPQKVQEFVWEKDWDTYLAPRYGKKYADLPAFVRPLLATKFEPRMFSVLSYGKIGRVTQKVLAIIELTVATTQKKEKRYDANIRTIYWL